MSTFSGAPIVCQPHCYTCGGLLPADAAEGWCSDLCERTVPVFRWACPCGRFIPEGSIETTDRRDDSTYYGISTEWRYTCSRCGVVYGEPWLTQIGTTITERGEAS